MKDPIYTEQVLGDPVFTDGQIAVPFDARVYVKSHTGVVDSVESSYEHTVDDDSSRGDNLAAAIEAAKTAALEAATALRNSPNVQEVLQTPEHAEWAAIHNPSA